MSVTTSKETPTKSDELSLKEFAIKIQEWQTYLLSRWLIILIVGLIGGFVGLSYSLYNKPVYSAVTTFVLEEDSHSGQGSLAGLASIAGIDLGSGGGGIFQGDNIIELYKSRRMIQQTLLTEVEYQGKKEFLINRYIELNRLRIKWSDRPLLLSVRFDHLSAPSRLRDSIINSVVQDINNKYLTVLKPDKKLSIIKVEVNSTDEFFAASFNTEIVRNVNEFYLKTKIKKSLENVKILQQKADSVRSVMNGSIYTAATVADATPNLNPTRGAKRIAPIQKAQFSAETNKAILSNLVQNLEMSKISLIKDAPLLQIVDEPILPLPVERLGKIKSTLIGGALGIFLICIFLISKQLIKIILI